MSTDKRLAQLRVAIDTALANPEDQDAQRRVGRLAAGLALLVLDRDDDRRELLLHLLAEAAGRQAGTPHPMSKVLLGSAQRPRGREARCADKKMTTISQPPPPPHLKATR